MSVEPTGHQQVLVEPTGYGMLPGERCITVTLSTVDGQRLV